MTPAQLEQHIRGALEALRQRGTVLRDTPERIVVRRPRSAEHGDWTCSVALQVAGEGAAARDIAERLGHQLREQPGIDRVEVAGPGFVNIWVAAGAAAELLRTIVDAGRGPRRFGTNDSMAGRVINVEFVSANPTGPLHLGHTRWAAIGDALRRIFAASGAEVTAEHYVNDAGAQVERLGASILARAEGREVPEDGYPGEEVAEIAIQIRQQHPEILTLPREQALALAGAQGEQRMLAAIRRTLEAFAVHFDVWFSERTLHESGAVQAAVATLREQGHVEDREGAVWLRTTDFGDDRDRVLIRADGRPTYFAADAAYYLSKRERGFTEKVYLLGADHHGYVARLRAVAACAGDDPDVAIEVLIGQLVTIRGARMGRRRGNAVLLDDLLGWIGSDPMRYSLARFPLDTPLDLDGEELRRRSDDNPVYAVQYAHARTHAVAQRARQQGVRRDDGFAPASLDHPREAALVAALADFPRVVQRAATERQPHHVARYLEELGHAYHRWYDSCRVTPLTHDEPVTDLHRTRLWLNDAAGCVFATGLDLLGVQAPERM